MVEFAQFDSEILYNDTHKIQNCPHTQRTAHFKVKRILAGEDRPLKLNLLIKLHMVLAITAQYTTKCKGDRVIALKRQISFW